MPAPKEIEVDDMADLYYDSDSSSGEQVFVTTDLFLHAYHLIFDRMLQDIEEKKFLPAVTNLSKALAKTSEDEVKGAPLNMPAIREALLYDLLYFSVAAKVLDPSFAVPAAIRSQTEALVARINSGKANCPLPRTSGGSAKKTSRNIRYVDTMPRTRHCEDTFAA
jgi:hypothetical protein